jgi:hypothetical protein
VLSIELCAPFAGTSCRGVLNFGRDCDDVSDCGETGDPDAADCSSGGTCTYSCTNVEECPLNATACRALRCAL